MKLPNIQKRTIIKNTLICAFLVACGWYLKARLSPQMPMGMGARPDPYVLIQSVEVMDISPAKTFVGIVEALESVDIKPRVTGPIVKVSFEEGSLVNKNDVLFTIDQDQYKANLSLAEAELAKAQAALKQIAREYERQKSLNQQKFASEAALETAESKYLQAQADIKQAKANLDLAKLNFEYTEVRAPITGYIGKALVTEGNIVTATNQTLARIVQMDPIRVSFSMTDKDFLAFKRANIENKTEKFRTELILPDGSIIYNHFISRFNDNEINSETATLAVYAEFGNENQLLIPGSYVRVIIRPKEEVKALLIPQIALAQDEVGNYVYAVNQDGVAEQKRLVLGDTIGEKQVVKSGLAETDNVIIQGLQKVTNGQKVKYTLIGKEEVK
ncbi:MAG: efflux RND transporter periplasmic adaptor subunit [Lactobacillaceae bacterium]|jgi:membrane fusion protein (multidrug efflux system)|nr:efflux RND transporter periplasmic adaptor subunit [Lactobacillaceae bacterium]